MSRKSLMILLIYTLFFLYIGLWDEIVYRLKFNQWNIIGLKWRVTNHNLYSNLYIVGLFSFITYEIYFLLRNKKN